jgi:hypothetical protein
VSDADRRLRARRAAMDVSDTEAAQAASTDRVRAAGPHGASMFRLVPLGEWCAFASGPNFLDVGILVDCFVDELGRVCAVVDRVRRLQDETDTALSWLLAVGDGLVVPSTSVTHFQGAASRWGSRFQPWGGA